MLYLSLSMLAVSDLALIWDCCVFCSSPGQCTVRNDDVIHWWCSPGKHREVVVLALLGVFILLSILLSAASFPSVLFKAL